MNEIFRTGNGKISGTIVNTNGEPIENVSVIAEEMGEHDSDRMLFSTNPVLTNSKGRFKIKKVPIGTYKVLATSQDDVGYFSTDVFNVNVFARKTALVDMILSATVSDDAIFVGSEVCKLCHVNQHSDWQKIAHANTLLPPSDETVVVPFEDVTMFTSDNKIKFDAFISGDDYKVMLFDLNDDSITATYTVVRTHGGVAYVGKQRYHVVIGNSHYILPVQYNHRNIDPDDPDSAWGTYHPERWYNDDGTFKNSRQ